jgi:hypothetical protein
MPFKEYPKIKRLGSEENDGILLGTVVVQEKIDGANTSIWIENDELLCASRTQLLHGGFNGFYDWVKNNDRISQLFEHYPSYRLYGEWLVRHTLAYKETAYKDFYLFDIEENGKFLLQNEVEETAEIFGLQYAEIFATLKNPTLEQIMEYVGKSHIGDKGEGVVLKNIEYVNTFGDTVYAKIVTQSFKEDNALVFGGNNKHSDTYWEMYVVNKYMTLPRIQKIMNKLQPQIDVRLNREHTARMINTAYHDMITEEIWEIQKKVPVIDFKKLAKLSQRKAVKIFHDILDNHISVAYETSNHS